MLWYPSCTSSFPSFPTSPSFAMMTPATDGTGGSVSWRQPSTSAYLESHSRREVWRYPCFRGVTCIFVVCSGVLCIPHIDAAVADEAGGGGQHREREPPREHVLPAQVPDALGPRRAAHGGSMVYQPMCIIPLCRVVRGTVDAMGSLYLLSSCDGHPMCLLAVRSTSRSWMRCCRCRLTQPSARWT